MTNTNLSLIEKTTNQKVVEETTRDRRIPKSIVVAYSCEIVRVDSERETYKVQSETEVNRYYIVKFIDGCPVYCTCKDWEIQSQKNPNHICKHMRGVVLAENYGLISKQHYRSKNWKGDEYSY